MNKIKPVYRSLKGKLYVGDCLDVLKQLPNESIHCCVTSPPYYKKRIYTDSDKEIGKEQLPEDYIDNLIEVFMEVKRVLVKTGTMWINIGDKYSLGKVKKRGSVPLSNLDEKGGLARRSPIQDCSRSKYNLKVKDLMCLPWILGLELRDKGLYLRQEIIWYKKFAIEPVRDRCTSTHEYILLLSKSSRYYFDYKAISEKTEARQKQVFKIDDSVSLNSRKIKKRYYEKKRKKSVWQISSVNTGNGHYAAFPEELVKNCLLAGCPENGYVLDPFIGSGTTAIVANRFNRKFIGIDLSREYVKKIAIPRIKEEIDRPKLNIRRKKKEAEDLAREQTKIF